MTMLCDRDLTTTGLLKLGFESHCRCVCVCVCVCEERIGLKNWSVSLRRVEEIMSEGRREEGEKPGGGANK